MSKNIKARIEMVRAMETVMRNLNDEDDFEIWLTSGVADGDIDENTTDEELEYYAESETFADLMDTFVYIFQQTSRRGALYCDGVVSKASN